MYCFMTMTTSKPGNPSVWESTGHVMLTSYEMKIIEADTHHQLLERFVNQAKEWLVNHPDREALEITKFSIEHIILRFPELILFEGSAESYLADIFHKNYEIKADNGTRCVIGAKDCWDYSFTGLRRKMEEANVLPCNPRHFNSASVESAEAREMLHGAASEYANYWNRLSWRLKSDIDQKPGFIENINVELEHIAHNPCLSSFSLKYFVGEH